jgi:hypothetical protein
MIYTGVTVTGRNPCGAGNKINISWTMIRDIRVIKLYGRNNYTAINGSGQGIQHWQGHAGGFLSW